MIIELQRTLCPEDMRETRCSICGRTFKIGCVTIWTLTDERGIDLGEMCPTCLKWLGRRAAEDDVGRRFPTLEEFQALEAEWRTPTYASSEEADRAMGWGRLLKRKGARTG
jgi:hypothetical protein